MKSKTCQKCRLKLPLLQFNKNNYKTDGLDVFCRKCRGEYARKYYSNNKQKAIKKACERRTELNKWFRDLKSKLSCLACGESHPACLEFHHRDPSTKETTVSEMVTRALGKAKILLEIQKCTVLCANCHRKLHHQINVAVEI